MRRVKLERVLWGQAAVIALALSSCVNFEGETPECFPDEGVCGEGRACVANRCVPAPAVDAGADAGEPEDEGVEPADTSVADVGPCEPEAEERCNGVDDDCDDAIDEAFPQLGTPCMVGTGECIAPGVLQCDPADPEGLPICIGEMGETGEERCNGVDDDCDGLIDEDYRGVGQPCTEGVGQCVAEGTRICAEDGDDVRCDATPGAPGVERCDESDGLDNDCDGLTDEASLGLGMDCEVGVGACVRRGVQTCDQGANPPALSCSVTPGPPAPNDVNCDGVDEDCDGTADEDFAPMVVTCGMGECVAEGTQRCEGGRVIDVCEPAQGAPADPCNNIDDDCDGRLDEDAPVVQIECGVGFCQRNGERRCEGGAIVDVCTPGEPLRNDRTCDGIDTDCDGEMDENFEEIEVTCGIGACRAEGALICRPGGAVQECEPGQPAAEEIECEGEDEDCDGQIDEGCPGD